MFCTNNFDYNNIYCYSDDKEIYIDDGPLSDPFIQRLEGFSKNPNYIDLMYFALYKFKHILYLIMCIVCIFIFYTHYDNRYKYLIKL
jgi:hypothetical protein